VEDAEGVKRMYSPMHMRERMEAIERKLDSILQND
jgi:hypothetical protein